MQNVSAEWKNVNQRFLLPESYLEISCRVPDITYVVSAVEVPNEATFSNKTGVVSEGSGALPLYATMEHNMWSLDGTRGILPDGEGNITPGYVSLDDSPTELTVVLSEAIESSVPGVTVTWSSEFSEYPDTFTVVAKNGETVVDSVTITGNTSVKTVVDFEVGYFDRITIEPHDWILPYRRMRVDQVVIGHDLTFNKGDIVSYQHEHSGDILCGELPKNTIRFSVLNVDGRWNPSNPSGLWRYLSDRQKITAKYGLTVNGNIEWIPAGVFYLSNWNAPANGLEASFEARDIFEFLLNEPYTGRTTGSLAEMVSDALGGLVPNVVFTQALIDTTGTISGEEKAAEVIQMCANAGCSSVYQDRDGSLVFKDWPTFAVSDYVIDSALAYSHPEITLSKPLRGVSVAYGSNEETLEVPVETSGEVQTVTNALVGTVEQAVLVADWIKTVLESRRTIAGEFRADPRLDLYDIVTVMSKHGAILPVVITNIQYSYTGCFKASYTGRAIAGGSSSIIGEMVLGESYIA